MTERVSETTIFYDPATGHYGFSTRFPGRHPHHSIVTFDSVEEVLALVRSASRTHLGRSQRRGRNQTANLARFQGTNCRLAHGAFDADRVVRYRNLTKVAFEPCSDSVIPFPPIANDFVHISRVHNEFIRLLQGGEFHSESSGLCSRHLFVICASMSSGTLTASGQFITDLSCNAAVPFRS